MSITHSRACPGCGKWLSDSQEICNQCGAPRNLFEEESPDEESVEIRNGHNKVNFKAGKLSLLIGLWTLFFPTILVIPYMITSLRDEPLHTMVVASIFPCLYLFLLYTATKSFIKYRIQKKKSKKKNRENPADLPYT